MTASWEWRSGLRPDYARRLAPQHAAIVVEPNGVDVARFQRVAQSRPPTTTGVTIGFVGTYVTHDVQFGFVDGRPRDAVFDRELDAELARLRTFLA